MTELPLVSIIMPIRNERRHIVACLDSVIGGDYPVDRLELLAIDGDSDDGTTELIASHAAGHATIRLLRNERRTQPFALNLGLQEARGEIIVRMDAHAVYPPDYVRRCVTGLISSGADNIGGTWTTVPADESPMARTIAVAMSHPFGIGNASYRLGTQEPRWVDTVPFGCWRRSLLLELGGFATDLPRNEDDELNGRLVQRGGRVLLDPRINSRYIARGTLRQLAAMLYQYGYGKPLVARRLGRLTTIRQLAPPAMTAALIVAAGAGLLWWPAWLILAGMVLAHLALGLAGGASQARRHGLAVGLRLPVVFLAMHLAYGWGYLRGLVDLALGRQPSSAQARLTR